MERKCGEKNWCEGRERGEGARRRRGEGGGGKSAEAPAMAGAGGGRLQARQLRPHARPDLPLHGGPQRDRELCEQGRLAV